MSNPFFKAFNQSLKTAGKVMGEEWIFAGTTYPAIAIDSLERGTNVMKGGRLLDVHVSITISAALFASTGVQEGSKVQARGERLRVVSVTNDGDAARELVCGPEGFTTPGR